nr:RidA family protein [uncultured Mucilaginibacter sp.]
MKYITAEDAPKALGPYSQAVRTGNLLYCSGQTPVDPLTMKIAAGTIEDETKRAIANLEIVLQAAGLTLQNVVKVNVFLTDMEMFAAMNGVYAQCFGTNKPARSTVAVNGLPMGARVEIECIAEFNN